MTSTMTPSDGALFTREWRPAENPWLHLVLVHGVAEHSGRYGLVAQQFADAGIAVRALDLRGHGKSPGRRGDVEQWTDFTGDVGRMVDDVRSAADERPVALMGHSMGGLIVLDAVLSSAATPDLLVLSTPGLGDDLPRWQHIVAPLLARVRPTLILANGWNGAALSRDPAVGQAADADPMMLDGVTVRLGAAGFAAQDRVNARIDQLSLPTYVTQGGQDPLVPPAATEPLGRLPGVTRVVYPELRHETLFEPEGPEVAAAIIAWLRRAADGSA